MRNEFRTIDITTLRQNTAQTLSSLPKNGPLFIFRRSKPAAVLLSAEEYTEMVETIEDLLDAQEIERSLGESLTPLSSYIKQRWGKTKL